MRYDFSVYVDITKYSGSKILGRCPLHDDRSPSFSADEDTGLWICYAGCGSGSLEVLEYLLEQDKRPTKSLLLNNEKSANRPQKKTKTYSPTLHLDGEYLYRDAIGFPKLKVIRTAHPIKGKSFIQNYFRSGTWVVGGYAGPIAPYRFHNWKDASGPVFLVEGEKKVEALFSLGLLASTTPKGASSWKPAFAKYFSDKDVVILPDNDVPGRKYAEAAKKDLLPKVRSLKIIQLPGLELAEDVYDWIQAGGSREGLLELVKDAPDIS